jgi:outer membrane murein-binding lipoprotein Lpp
MQVLDRILADLYAPKEGASNGMKGDRESICSHLLWASFKTLDVAQVYVDANFVNHPAISSEFIKFLATNSGSEKIEQLTATVTVMKSSLAGCVTDVRNASTKSDTASTKCGELNALIMALTNRVKALENRPRGG